MQRGWGGGPYICPYICTSICPYILCFFILHFYIGFHVCIFDFWALDILLLYLHRYSCLCSAGYSILHMYICMYYVPTYLQYVHCFILHFYIGFHMCIFDLWALDILLTYLHMYSCSRSPGYLILLMYTCNFCNVIACFTLNRYFKVYKHQITVKMPHSNEFYSSTTKL